MSFPRCRVNLYEKFHEYFELVPAKTEALKREVYKLRFQVYCVETGFERREDCEVLVEDGKTVYLEKDEYDLRSEHYLIRHRRTGLFAATVRLVMPDPDDLFAPFPIEVHCILDEPVTDPQRRKHLVEISRFAVSREFKRRAGEAGTLAGIGRRPEVYFEEDERRILPHIMLGLIAAIVRMCREHGMTHWYAVMERSLFRFLRLIGIRFSPIGPEVDYHGLRYPGLAEMKRVLCNVKRVNRPVWDLITDCGKYG